MITCCDRASENCGFDPQEIADLRPDPRILVAGPLGELHGASLTMFHCPSFSGLEPETLDLQYQFCHSKYSMHKSIVSIE